MRRILRWRSVLDRITSSNRVKLYPNHSFCSSTHSKKPTTINSSSDNGSSSSPSLTSYKDQYKALENLDFMTAAKILFSDSPKEKKKFGLDFHLVQLFFVCLPSLAVYLVAQYARSEMRKMDAELERKKQAEFEGQAKEMEAKAAKEKEAAASSPEKLEMEERLRKLEDDVKGISVGLRKLAGDTIKKGQEDGNEQKKSDHDQVEPDTIQNESKISSEDGNEQKKSAQVEPDDKIQNESKEKRKGFK